MTVFTAVYIFTSVVTLTVTGGIAALMLWNPQRGLAYLTHQSEHLPQVMTGRYVTFFAFTVMTVIYGDLRVMLGLQLGFIVASLSDVYIYARVGLPFAKHLSAAGASAIAAALCLYAVGI